MPSLDLEHFKARLLQAREELRAYQQTRDAASATVVLDQTSVGRLSRMDALQQQAMAQNSNRRAEQSLQRIQAALQRCEEGRFGDCLACDEPINPQRLELDPATSLCIRCAEARGQ